jgi:GntR family transcriptional repressor for pyruvate dehydrogenase complex
MSEIRAIPRAYLSDQVANELSRLIVDGTFGPETALPSEGALATRFGVSRASVREAVKMLAARGLIQVRHGVGLFVSGATAQPVSDALELLLARERVGPDAQLEARRLVVVEIAGLAAERATSEDLRRVEEALAGLGRTDQPIEAQIAADTEFHVALARAAHNPVYLAVGEAVRKPLAESMRATYPVDGGPARRHREHAGIFQAVRARRPSEARAAMAHLLETSAEAIRRSAETPRTTPAPAARPKRSPRRP